MVFKFLASGKGSLDLEVTNRAYAPGEFVEAVAHLTTKKDLGPGRLYAALICIEEVRQWRTDMDGDRTRETERNELFRWEQDLAVDAAFPAGTDERFSFTLQIPRGPDHQPPADAPPWVGTVMDVFGAMAAANRKAWWEVEVRYDIPKLDLKDDVRLSVNGF